MTWADCKARTTVRHSRSMSSAPIPRAGLILLGLLSLGWGFNWPIMKVVISEIPRLIFRGDCMLLASIGLFAIAKFSGQSLRVPAGRWRQLIALASCNIVGWNVFAIYGVSMLPSGRAAILGYTMEEYIGRNAFDLLHPDDLQNAQEAFGSLHATGPAWVANFNDLHEPRARDILIADVYKTFERFFQLLS